ncbi:uncharacterized protein LOC135092993 isoform X2 [Scylla paramamosain]|uniref:uncharacterized protein LOC135092993 isoform X2 n=1 Tax=Scylla paramamosain TaxID=85552 RepID=UPI0030834081
MQVCPGDLLVYSKVLTQRTNLIAGDLDGSTQSLAVTEADPVGNRKGKNTWSLLRLFDRSNRTKSESLCGLEEVLSCLQPSEFEDEQLSRYKGMCWTDFVSYKEGGHQGDSPTKEGEVTSSPPMVALNDRALLITPAKPETRPERLERHDQVMALTCLDSDAPLMPRRRHPMTIMRTMSERSLDRGRSGFLNMLSERVHHSERASMRAFNKSSVLSGSPFSSFKSSNNATTATAAAAATATTTASTTSSVTSPCTTEMASVERALEAARENVRASLNKTETKRREAVWDLFQSECAFLYDHLMVLKNVYMEPLKKIQVDGYAMFAEPELLFGNLDELCCVTYAFCKEFINLLEQQQTPVGQLDTTNVLVRLFQKGSKAVMLCQAYHRYALNYINALNYLETLRRQLEFCEFEKWCNRDPRCKKLQLTDLLVAPVQHIMKVPLILRDIEARTEEPQERAVVREIIEAEEHSLRELDDKMKWLKNFERLLEIQRNIFWPPVTELDPKVYIPEFLKGAISRQPCERLIVSPRRQIILEGSLHMLDHNKPQEMYVILFDDMLLITRRKKGLHKKKSSLTENWPSSCSRASSGGDSALRYIVYKQPLSLDRFFIHDVTPHESAASKLEAAFVLVNLNRFQQIVTVCTFQAQTEQIKVSQVRRGSQVTQLIYFSSTSRRQMVQVAGLVVVMLVMVSKCHSASHSPPPPPSSVHHYDHHHLHFSPRLAVECNHSSSFHTGRRGRGGGRGGGGEEWRVKNYGSEGEGREVRETETRDMQEEREIGERRDWRERDDWEGRREERGRREEKGGGMSRVRGERRRGEWKGGDNKERDEDDGIREEEELEIMIRIERNDRDRRTEHKREGREEVEEEEEEEEEGEEEERRKQARREEIEKAAERRKADDGNKRRHERRGRRERGISGENGDYERRKERGTSKEMEYVTRKERDDKDKGRGGERGIRGKRLAEDMEEDDKEQKIGKEKESNKEMEDVPRKEAKEKSEGRGEERGTKGEEKIETKSKSDSSPFNQNKRHLELPLTLSSLTSDLLQDSQRLKGALYSLLQATRDHPGAAVHAVLLGEVDTPAGELVNLLTKSFKGADSEAPRLALSSVVSGVSPTELLADGGSFVSSEERNPRISLPTEKIVTDGVLPNDARDSGSFFSSKESNQDASKSRASAPSGKNVSENLTPTNNTADSGPFFSSEERNSIHIDSRTPAPPGKTLSTSEGRRRRRQSQGVMYLPINPPRPDPCAPPKGAGLLKALPLVLLSSLLSVADAVATVVNNLNSNNNNNNNNIDNNVNSDNTNVDANINNANQINIVPFDGRRALRLARQGMHSVGRAALDVWRAVAGDGDDDEGAEEGEGKDVDVSDGDEDAGGDGGNYADSGGGGGDDNVEKNDEEDAEGNDDDGGADEGDEEQKVNDDEGDNEGKDAGRHQHTYSASTRKNEGGNSSIGGYACGLSSTNKPRPSQRPGAPSLDSLPCKTEKKSGTSSGSAHYPSGAPSAPPSVEFRASGVKVPRILQ